MYNILIDNLVPSQLGYNLIMGLNQYLDNNPNINFNVFCNGIVSPFIPASFAIFNINEIWNQNGICIATCLSTASRLINCVGNKDKYFYVWDIEWMLPQIYSSYDRFMTIYQNPELKLIARTTLYQSLLESVTNRKVIGVVDNFNVEKIVEIINGQKTN